MVALSLGSSWFSCMLVHTLASVCPFPQCAWRELSRDRGVVSSMAIHELKVKLIMTGRQGMEHSEPNIYLVFLAVRAGQGPGAGE